MKDTFGSMTAIWLFTIFFVIYVCFIAAALQYAKAYRMKNTIINYLETRQYEDTSSTTDLETVSIIEDYLASVPYNFDSSSASSSSACDGATTIIDGVCIIPEGKTARYYKVVVFIPFEFPFLNVALTAIPVSGETKVIYYTT